MKWNKEAQEVVDAIPMPEIMKNMTILYAEKLARKNKKKGGFNGGGESNTG